MGNWGNYSRLNNLHIYLVLGNNTLDPWLNGGLRIALDHFVSVYWLSVLVPSHFLKFLTKTRTSRKPTWHHNIISAPFIIPEFSPQRLIHVGYGVFISFPLAATLHNCNIGDVNGFMGRQSPNTWKHQTSFTHIKNTKECQDKWQRDQQHSPEPGGCKLPSTKAH